MLIPDRFEIGFTFKQKNDLQGYFWGEVPDISHKNKDARDTAVSWVYV